MPGSSNDWQANVRRALLRDPKKTVVMAVLLIVLMIVSIRTFGGGSSVGPAVASANVAVHSTTPATVALPSSPSPHIDAALREWLRTPAPRTIRNEFLLRGETFPIDAAKSPALSDGEFWTRLRKSLASQADQINRRQDRIDAIRRDAESIRPQSTMLGANPRAIVNDRLLAEGDTVSGFHVVRIQSHGIIVQRQGVVLDVPMR